MRLATIALPLLALLSALSASCGKDAPDTLIRLVIDSDLEVGTELTKLEVRIFDRDGKEELRRQDFVLGAKREGARYALPLSIKLAPDSQGSNADFRLVVTGIGPVGEGGSDVEVVEQQATASFRPGQALRLDVFLARNCLFKLCRDDDALSGLTCSERTGDCVDIPTRENLPVVTGDGVGEYEDEKSEAGAIVRPADDGGFEDSDSGVRGESSLALDAAVTDGAMAEADTSSLPEASMSDGSTLRPDASLAAMGNNVCSPSPCLNGGTCSPTGTLCSCSVGFAGHRCETNVCQPNPCGANGTCMPSGSSYSCACKAGYVGTGSQRCDVGFAAVASQTSSNNACALLSDGRVACWGENSFRYLFAENRNAISNPVVVAGITGSGGPQLAVGNGFACLQSGGRANCWGTNYGGQLGDGSIQSSYTAVRVNEPSLISRIGAGTTQACVVLANQTVTCWGTNDSGELGSGVLGEVVLTPRAVPSLSGVVDLITGYFHTCATRLSAGPVCWGSGFDGELGNGLQERSMSPVAVLGLRSPNTTIQMSVGAGFTCALNISGTVECWGRNVLGVLGNGTQVPSLSPVAVRNLTDATAIASGSYHSCALRTNGQVMCWGWNEKGQLGDGTIQDSNVPVAVQNLTNADSIACGQAFSCAHVREGRIYCWGSNVYGELGNGQAEGSALPVQVNLVR